MAAKPNPLVDALRRVPGGVKPWMTATPAPTTPPRMPQPPGGEGKQPQGKRTPPIVPGRPNRPPVTVHTSWR